MTLETFEAVRTIGGDIGLELQRSDANLRTYTGERIPVRGEFSAVLHYGDQHLGAPSGVNGAPCTWGRCLPTGSKVLQPTHTTQELPEVVDTEGTRDLQPTPKTRNGDSKHQPNHQTRRTETRDAKHRPQKRPDRPTRQDTTDAHRTHQTTRWTSPGNPQDGFLKAGTGDPTSRPAVATRRGCRNEPWAATHLPLLHMWEGGRSKFHPVH